MKTILASAVASALVLGLSLSPLTASPPPAKLVQGSEYPILLMRMVVTATPLP